MKFATNTTATAIELTKIGVTLQPSVLFTIQPSQYLMWAQHSGAGSQLETAVTSGDIVISDGLSPALNAVLGLALLRDALARDVAFDNRTNGFLSTQVQAAIEEARTAPAAVFACDSAVAIGDLVTASAAADGTVEVVTDNLYANVVVGVVVSKPTLTQAVVRQIGIQGGFSGLTRGRIVFVGTDGKPTTTFPATGNRQSIGTATSATHILFNINLDKTVRI